MVTLESWGTDHYLLGQTARSSSSHCAETPVGSSVPLAVDCFSVAQSSLTLLDPVDCSTPGFPVYHQLLELAQIMSIESVMPSNYLILCRSLLLLCSIFPSIRVFSNE